LPKYPGFPGLPGDDVDFSEDLKKKAWHRAYFGKKTWCNTRTWKKNL
jgi:hypothetical protein